ncbi:hypothetical protein, partial [Brasilonema sp. UFV-L1]|uniref:hypothetical protein n=1 Tax=Brasilonema sp. UFV-L1 TaxID=2234130 RepID=UPI001B7CF4E1
LWNNLFESPSFQQGGYVKANNLAVMLELAVGWVCPTQLQNKFANFCSNAILIPLSVSVV